MKQVIVRDGNKVLAKFFASNLHEMFDRLYALDLVGVGWIETRDAE